MWHSLSSSFLSFSWSAINHPDRLQYPLIRRNGKLQRASWDEAMTLIVDKAQELRSRLTNHGIAFYTTGQLFLEEFYVLAMVGKAGLNTLHMYATSSISILCVPYVSGLLTFTGMAIHGCAPQPLLPVCASPLAAMASRVPIRTLIIRTAYFSWATTWRIHRQYCGLGFSIASRDHVRRNSSWLIRESLTRRGRPQFTWLPRLGPMLRCSTESSICFLKTDGSNLSFCRSTSLAWKTSARWCLSIRQNMSKKSQVFRPHT